MVDVLLLVRVARIVLLLVGGYIVILAYRGYRRYSARPMLYLSAGFAVVTLGNLAEGILFEFLHWDLSGVFLVGTVVEILGFLAIIYSIYCAK